MDIQELQNEVYKWSQKNFPNNAPYHPLLGVGEEVGELMHAFLKKDQKIRGTQEEHEIAMKDAVGDIVIYLCDFCSRNNIDFKQCITMAWNEVKNRDWNKHRKENNGLA